MQARTVQKKLCQNCIIVYVWGIAAGFIHSFTFIWNFMQGELRSNPFMPGGNKRSTYLNKPAIVTVCDREIHKNTEK